MSDSLEEVKAWAWYDPLDGSVKHVSFIMDHVHPDGTEQIAMDAGTAKDILLGNSRLYEYKVITDGGTPVVKYQPVTVTAYFSKFWSLEEETPIDRLPWMGMFGDANEFKSPLRISITEQGFDIMVVSLATKGKVYITRKNDPNYLVRTVDLEQAIEEYELGPIPVTMEDSDEYSVYVRYYNAT